MCQLQALRDRLLQLQKQLDAPEKPAFSKEALDTVASQLAAIEATAPPDTAPPDTAPPACDPPAKRVSGNSFESFAQFAAEGSRVQNTGRQLFGSDYYKIRPTKTS